MVTLPQGDTVHGAPCPVRKAHRHVAAGVVTVPELER